MGFDAGFVPLGEETVRVVGNPDRVEKPGVTALREAVAEGEDVFDSPAGYGR